jgi:hypothetical protein
MSTQATASRDSGSHEIIQANARPDSRAAESTGANGRTAASVLNVPEFGAKGEIFAVTARIAGRINAASVSEDEHQTLLNERQILLDHKFNGSLDRKGAHRLEYVRWSLDRIEDARYGHILDAIEDGVARYERFLDDMQSLQAQLNEQARRRR